MEAPATLATLRLVIGALGRFSRLMIFTKVV
jgi:hypothetical protein